MLLTFRLRWAVIHLEWRALVLLGEFAHLQSVLASLLMPGVDKITRLQKVQLRAIQSRESSTQHA